MYVILDGYLLIYHYGISIKHHMWIVEKSAFQFAPSRNIGILQLKANYMIPCTQFN